MNTAFMLSLAYRYVATIAMLLDINYCAAKLELPIRLPLRPELVDAVYVNPPRVFVGGSVITQGYFFGYSHSGQLRFIYRRFPDSRSSLVERQMRWARMRSLITTTNEAYRLATNVLWRIEVNVNALERSNQVAVVQHFFYGGDGVRAGSKVDLPAYDVRWSHGGEQAVAVTLFGPDKRVLQLVQDDISFSGRPRELIRNAEELLEIRDEEFQRYSKAQLRDLLARSLVLPYSSRSNIYLGVPWTNLLRHATVGLPAHVTGAPAR